MEKEKKQGQAQPQPKPKGWGGEGSETEQLWAWTSLDKPVRLKLSDGHELVGTVRQAEKYWLILCVEKEERTVIVNKAHILTMEAA